MVKTSTFERESLLLAHIGQWVEKTLNGRYREYVSDKFLSFLLTQDLRSIIYDAKPKEEDHLEHPYCRRDQIAYSAGCRVFESNLEHNCRAGGNGHHVAQSFATCINSFSVSPF